MRALAGWLLTAPTAPPAPTTLPLVLKRKSRRKTLLTLSVFVLKSLLQRVQVVQWLKSFFHFWPPSIPAKGRYCSLKEKCWRICINFQQLKKCPTIWNKFVQTKFPLSLSTSLLGKIICQSLHLSGPRQCQHNLFKQTNIKTARFCGIKCSLGTHP